jgi:murein DD-endopeptidase MepM/ murein hydrolase activator NlpD
MVGPKGGERTHKVRKGETLSSIAKKYYGDANQWREIAVASGVQMPYKLQPGQVLQVPEPVKEEKGKETKKRKCRCTYTCTATLKKATKFYKEGKGIEFQRVRISECPCPLVLEEERDDANVVCDLIKDEEIEA